MGTVHHKAWMRWSPKLERELASEARKLLSRNAFSMRRARHVLGGAFTDEPEQITESNSLLAASILSAARAATRPKFGINHSWPLTGESWNHTVGTRLLERRLRGAIAHAKWIANNRRPTGCSKILIGDSLEK